VRLGKEDRADGDEVDVARSGDVEPVDVGRQAADLDRTDVADVDAAGKGLGLEQAGSGLDRIDRRTDAADGAHDQRAGGDVACGIDAALGDGGVGGESDG